MKPVSKKEEFVRLRAEGLSFCAIAQRIHVSKSTLVKWERELDEVVYKLKQERIEDLQAQYGMTREGRIRRLGTGLEKIEEAIENADFSKVPPGKLLELKLKYAEAIKGEYTGTEHTSNYYVDKLESILKNN